MSIKVCDAIMGSGKSSAAINYMNMHPDQKFIYITPYLEEAKRIRESCPALHFKEPNNKLPEFGFRKFKHTEALLAAGENITSTHRMFLRYSDDMIQHIKRHGYTLIIDESVDVFSQMPVKVSDIRLLKSAGWTVQNDDRTITVTPPTDYTDGFFNDVVSLSRGNRMVAMDMGTADKDFYYYWLFSKEILLAFSNVFVLTYLFESQNLKYYFDIHKIEYEKIYVSISKDGKYRFDRRFGYMPEYTRHLSELIHIFENKKINSIGDNRCALSYSWYQNAGSSGDPKSKIERLRKNIRNYFVNYHGDKSSDSRLWAVFDNAKPKVRGKGYYYSGIAFNTKATNDYRDRQVLAYCVNLFLRPWEKHYFTSMGVDVREDEYALSVMIQWIWRSAIRDGKEIWIYIPSRRMRNILKNWIETVEKTSKGEINK